jgi:predicted nucleic acid-binding protein
LAEALDAPLVTLDRRLVASPGLRCDVEVPLG